MFNRKKSSALKSMMSKSPGGSKFAAGRSAMKARRDSELEEAALHALAQFSGSIETMFLAACADGEVSDDELNHMADIVVDITDGDLNRKDAVTMFNSFAEQIEEDGYEARLDVLSDALDDDTRRSAFALAAAVAMGDGELEEGEEEFFYDLADVYEIDEEEAEGILESVAEALQG
jgi:tellurite resistance protein